MLPASGIRCWPNTTCKQRDTTMANEMTKQHNSGQLALGGENPFLQYGEAAKQTSIVGELLKFSKGDWMSGQDNTPIEEGTEFIANLDELLIGWIRWSEMKPTDHVMGKVSRNYQPPHRNELGDLDSNNWETDERGDYRDPWQKSNYLLLQGVSDRDGELFTFTTSSRGGLNAVGDLCLKYGKAIRQKPDQYPVIKIGTGSYMHSNKAFGRIKYPLFEIVGWVPKSKFVSVDEVERTADEIVPDTAASPQPPGKATKPAAGKPKAKARF